MPEIDGNATAKAGAPSEAIIDRVRLARMTLGDQRLEVEVLNLFERQADLPARTHARRAAGGGRRPSPIPSKSRARGGARKVAAAARAVELAARNSIPTFFPTRSGNSRPLSTRRAKPLPRWRVGRIRRR